MKAYLALEDGTIFEGESFGWPGERGGEAVFNTSLTGYQEILTDPSYRGQIVVMSYPMIGNYGVNPEDIESDLCRADGFIVKEYSKIYSNHRATKSLSEFLTDRKIIGISQIETRSVVKRIREKGAMRAYMACGGEFSRDYLLSRVGAVPSMEGLNLADEVSTPDKYCFGQETMKNGNRTIVVLDCGVKLNILRKLSRPGFDLVVVPSRTGSEEILKMRPSGVVLSNGPGDPAAVTGAIGTVKGLVGRVPIFGICLGHQILALSLGAKTYKLKFGHRGANHPVLHEKTGLVEITSQNHGFAVDADSLAGIAAGFGKVEITHRNLNDGTVEGISCPKMRACSVQYHPEASPGPHDSSYLFDDFFAMMDS